VKVVLVAALLKNQLWAYPWTIVFLGVFIVYQLYRLSLQPSVGLTALTIFDALIAWLTWREYRKQLAIARRKQGPAPSPARRATIMRLDMAEHYWRCVDPGSRPTAI
jgi:ABC-type nickel/cobalt efflux system permease component RcnA